MDGAGVFVGNPPSSPPADPVGGVSAERMARLERGVNLSEWFRFADPPLSEWFENRVSDAELTQLRGLGLTHVRLPISPEYIYDSTSPGVPNPDFVGYLDAAIARIVAHDLAVVIDFHNEDEEFFDLPDAAANISQFWSSLATHLSTTDPEMVFLELVNEPVFYGHEEDWQAVQTQVLAAMRDAAPEHTLIATGPFWSNIDYLDAIEPVADPNVVYTFHFYDPHIFSHQGSFWSEEYIQLASGLPYPSTPSNVAPLASRLQRELRNTPLSWVPDEIRRYGAERWNAAKVESRVATAADWAAEHGVQLYVGEFGVYREGGVRPADRAAWLRDVRTAFERHDIGWSVWAYDDNFGLATRLENLPAVAGPTTSGVPRVDPAIASALGLLRPLNAPLNALPLVQTAKEDTTLAFSTRNRNTVQVVDPNRSNLPVQVTIAADHGTLTLGSLRNIQFVVGDGRADATFTFRGTLTNVNAALKSLSFLPTANYSGDARIAIHSELIGASLAGTLGLAAADVDTIVVHVLPVNDAPTFASIGSVSLPNVTLGSPVGDGFLVADLLAGRDCDIDTGALRGIALVGTRTGRYDRWEISINGGLSWQAIGSVSDRAALLLRDTDRVRLVAATNSTTRATLQFRAWDQTRGAAGQKVNARSWGFGGVGPFSSLVAQAHTDLNSSTPGTPGVGVWVGS